MASGDIDRARAARELGWALRDAGVASVTFDATTGGIVSMVMAPRPDLDPLGARDTSILPAMPAGDSEAPTRYVDVFGDEVHP